MKRFAAMLLFAVSSAALAEEPGFCKSMCASEKRTCIVDAQARLKKEGYLLHDAPARNPLALTARLDMHSSDGGALQQSGETNRRMEQAGICDTAYQRCERGCKLPAPAKGAAPAKAVSQTAKD